MTSEQYQYAVIIEKTIHHEGDERSRTHPGHGYPAYDEVVQEFKAFKNEAEFREWIEREDARKYASVRYKPIAFKPVEIKKTVSFDINV